MKTQEEIEQLSETAFQDELIKSNQNINWIGYGKGIDGTSKERWIELWIKGYTQCQEDMADVIDSLKTQLIEFQSKEPKYAVEGDYCAVCGCTEFWNNGDEEE